MGGSRKGGARSAGGFRLLAGLGIVGSFCLAGGSEAAVRVLQAPEVFVREAFEGRPPSVRALWIGEELRREIETILGHRYRRMRVRYRARGDRSAWILDEVGKKRPITVGIVVDQGRIARLAILVYRESRGWEVEHPGFTGQFAGATLGEGGRLDRPIDGISGATLSVRAVERLARVALRLAREVSGR